MTEESEHKPISFKNTLWKRLSCKTCKIDSLSEFNPNKTIYIEYFIFHSFSKCSVPNGCCTSNYTA